VDQWPQSIQNDRTSRADENRSGCPTTWTADETERVEAVNAPVQEGRRIQTTWWTSAVDLQIPSSTRISSITEFVQVGAKAAYGWAQTDTCGNVQTIFAAK